MPNSQSNHSNTPGIESKKRRPSLMGHERPRGTRLVLSKKPGFDKGKGTVVMFKKSQSFGKDSYLSSSGDWFCPDYICRGG